MEATCAIVLRSSYRALTSGVNKRGVSLGVQSLELWSAQDDVEATDLVPLPADTSADLLVNQFLLHHILGATKYTDRNAFDL